MIIQEEHHNEMNCCVDTSHNCYGPKCMGWIPLTTFISKIALRHEIKELEQDGWRDRCEFDRETGGTLMTKFVPGGRCGRVK